MNIVAKSSIEAYCTTYPAAAAQLRAWYETVKKAKWQNPEEVKNKYPKVSVLKSGRLVFNIVGGSYRLIVHLDYPRQRMYILWFGTHQEYDKIDADTVE